VFVDLLQFSQKIVRTEISDKQTSHFYVVQLKIVPKGRESDEKRQHPSVL
jgi:hypothetical protein